MKRSALRFKHFCLKMIKNRRAKKSFFFADFALQNMVETTLPDGLETLFKGRIANFGISLDVFEFLQFG